MAIELLLRHFRGARTKQWGEIRTNGGGPDPAASEHAGVSQHSGANGGVSAIASETYLGPDG